MLSTLKYTNLEHKITSQFLILQNANSMKMYFPRLGCKILRAVEKNRPR